LKRELKVVLTQIESLMMSDISTFKTFLKKKSAELSSPSLSPKTKKVVRLVKVLKTKEIKKSFSKSVIGGGKSNSAIMISSNVPLKNNNIANISNSPSLNKNSPILSRLLSGDPSNQTAIPFSLSKKSPSSSNDNDDNNIINNNSSKKIHSSVNIADSSSSVIVSSPSLSKHKKSKSGSRIFSMSFKAKDKNITNTRISLSSDLFGFDSNAPKNPNKKHLKDIKNDESLKSSFEDFLTNNNTLNNWNFWLETSDLIEIDYDKQDEIDEILIKKIENIYQKYLLNDLVKKILYIFVFF
jgi:hypothetical protein